MAYTGSYENRLSGCTGTDNFEYLEKDVLGNPSVAGSIFLDAKSDRNFHDFYTVIMGHHMQGRKCSGILIYIPMFLSLKKYNRDTLRGRQDPEAGDGRNPEGRCV